MNLPPKPPQESRTRRATDKARNEQQKAVLLSEVARKRCQTASEDLVANARILLEESRKLVDRAARNRTRKRA